MKFFRGLFYFLLILIVLGTAVGLSYKFSDGFTKNPFEPSVNVPPAEETKEIVSTTIVSEKYGTFVVPKDSMFLSNTTNNLIFADCTDFNYIFDKEVEKLKDNNNITDESIFVFKCEKDNLLSDILNGTNVNFHSGSCYFVMENQKVQYLFSNDLPEKLYPYFLFNSMKLAMSLTNDEINASTEIDVNFYCKSLFFNETIKDYYGEKTLCLYFPSVIISDKGCPLTDYIYNEIIADESTQITYTYAE